MDRLAISIDAGYLLAAGGSATCGTKARASFAFDPTDFMAMLLPKLKTMSSLPLLRTYWYDGAKKGIPTVEQQTIASIPNLKLRLGRLNSRNQQKGVDALIYHDLITLASSRAIADALLLSGDEDLREGVRAAQNLGVRVGLVGVDEGGRRNQSHELCDEVDERMTLTVEDLAPFFHLLPSGISAQTGDLQGEEASPPALDLTEVTHCGRQFGQTWLSSASREDVHSLRSDRPKIPRPTMSTWFATQKLNLRSPFEAARMLAASCAEPFGRR